MKLEKILGLQKYRNKEKLKKTRENRSSSAKKMNVGKNQRKLYYNM